MSKLTFIVFALIRKDWLRGRDEKCIHLPKHKPFVSKILTVTILVDGLETALEKEYVARRI